MSFMNRVPLKSVHLFNSADNVFPDFSYAAALVKSFNSLCSSTLDLIAHLKNRYMTERQPWLNDSTRSCKGECRKAKHRWKKSEIQVHFDDLLLRYNTMVKDVRTCHFSELTSAHQPPDFLFETVDELVNQASPCACADSHADCEKSLLHLAGKMAFIRLDITLHRTFPDIVLLHQDSLSYFCPITLPQLIKILSYMTVSCQFFFK